jgi:hypothetical protein
MDTDEIEKAVEQRRAWLQDQLEAAAPRFGVELVGEVVNTYDMRSAGATAREGDHDVWMRVVVEDPDYQPACRWDGNVVANSIRGVPKPQVLRWSDWTNTDIHAHFDVELPDEVFEDLAWTTAHADLHWGNLRGPELCILDWESWRPAPAGYDAATLYCNSLLHPPTARRLRAQPVFETRSGQIALLFAIVRYLWVVGEGSDIDQLDRPLRAEAAKILSDLGAREHATEG